MGFEHLYKEPDSEKNSSLEPKIVFEQVLSILENNIFENTEVSYNFKKLITLLYISSGDDLDKKS